MVRIQHQEKSKRTYTVSELQPGTLYLLQYGAGYLYMIANGTPKKVILRFSKDEITALTPGSFKDDLFVKADLDTTVVISNEEDK